MQTLNLIPGTKEWLSVRAEYNVASEAPIMMGDSKNMSRDDLLKYKTIGDEQEITRFMKIIFDKGHEFEAMARPIAEGRIGQELFPAVGVKEIDGVKYLASFDGITAMDDDHWEHKQYNANLFILVQSGGELLPHHYWQLEHQLLVDGNESCVFAVSDGTKESYADVRYYSRPERRERLIIGWKQFNEDLKNYNPIIIEQKPVAEISESLPAFFFETKITGSEIELVSNLSAYKEAAIKLVERSKQVMESDQDFANAELRIKQCKEAEENIALWRKQIIGKFISVDQCDRGLAEIFELIRRCRLNEDAQVKSRKEQIRLSIINDAKADFESHIKVINAAFSEHNRGFNSVVMPIINADFAGSIKGKKTIKSLREAANDELARSKVEANRIAAIIDSNLDFMEKTAKEFSFLFADIRNLITKEREDLSAVSIKRISDHKRAEEEKNKASEIESKLETPIKQEIIHHEDELAKESIEAYFNNGIQSPVLNEKTGSNTVVGRSEIIQAVSQFWGISLSDAQASCVKAFNSK